MNRLNGTIDRMRPVWIVFSIVAIEAVFSIFFLNWQLATGSIHPGALIAICLLTLAVCVVVWRWKAQWSAALGSATKLFDLLSPASWIGFSFILGAILRLAWVWAYPAPQQSDHATYFQLARLIFENHRYGFPGGGLAYWPPGYPLFLAGWFSLLGIHNWIPLLENLLLFGGTLLVVERLATHVAGTTAGKVSAVLLAAWPTLVMTAGLASKEMLVLFLMPAALLSFTLALDAGPGWNARGLMVLAGLLLGCASLTQPSLLTFPAVLVALVWFRRQAYLREFLSIAIVVMGLAIVILPWTIRNHRVLGAWVPISTNGGDVFYRANNPLATGGYTPRGEQDLENYDELTRNKVGFKLGEAWVSTHPIQFLVLAVRKQILFLGDDAQGAFETLKRGLGRGGLVYALWKALCNFYWIGLWVLILIGLASHSKGALQRNPALAAIALSVLYLFAIHSIFESGAKYHQPIAGFLVILAAVAFLPREVASQPQS